MPPREALPSRDWAQSAGKSRAFPDTKKPAKGRKAEKEWPQTPMRHYQKAEPEAESKPMRLQEFILSRQVGGQVKKPRIQRRAEGDASTLWKGPPRRVLYLKELYMALV